MSDSREGVAMTTRTPPERYTEDTDHREHKMLENLLRGLITLQEYDDAIMWLRLYGVTP